MKESKMKKKEQGKIKENSQNKTSGEERKVIVENKELSDEQNLEEITKSFLEEEIEKEEIIEPEEMKEGAEVPFFYKTEEKCEGWEPKTKLGWDVKNNKIKDIDEILDTNKKILEEQIVDSLLNLRTELVLIGQAKGKFGGGKRRIWRQTQKKTNEGNIPTFSTMAIVGDGNGHVGIGYGKGKETLPTRDKAIRKAKLNIIKITRKCSSFDCLCDEPHTIPFKVEGKEGSVRVILIPAPQGTGLVVNPELKKLLELAGVKDVYSKTFGKKRTTFNLIKAGFNALKKTNIKLNKS
ncbi:MAG: 30S ribosomal protein S5 [Candidatus Pacearchaeota archaeon]